MNTKFEMFKFYFENCSLAQKILSSVTQKPGEVCRFDKQKDQSYLCITEDHGWEEVTEGKYVYPAEFEATSDTINKDFGIKEALAKSLLEEDQGIISLLTTGKDTDIVEKDITILLNKCKYLKREFMSAFLVSKKMAKTIVDMGVIKNYDAEQARFGYWGTYENTSILSTSDYHEEKCNVPDNLVVGVCSSLRLGITILRVPLSYSICDDGEIYFSLKSQIVFGKDRFILGKLDN